MGCTYAKWLKMTESDRRHALVSAQQQAIPQQPSVQPARCSSAISLSVHIEKASAASTLRKSNGIREQVNAAATSGVVANDAKYAVDILNVPSCAFYSSLSVVRSFVY